MKRFENLQNSREFKTAQEMENAINSTCFSPQMFAASIPYMHRTLQQSMWRVIRACIAVYADPEYSYDLRNKAAHEEAVEMAKYLEEHGQYIPMI